MNGVLMKTQMCTRGNRCKFNKRGECWFAHTPEELRCLEYASTGKCKNNRCPLLHIRYHRKQRKARESGRAPPGEKLPYKQELELYKLPSDMKDLVPLNPHEVRAARVMAVKLLEERFGLRPSSGQPVEPTPVDKDNYKEKFAIMLQGEELFERLDLKEYSLRGETLQYVSREDLYRVDVPGLAENRPSVLRGDRLVVYDDVNDYWYGGSIFYVNIDHLLFSMPRQVDQSLREKVDVEFEITRTSIQVQRRAVAKCPFLDFDMASEKTTLNLPPPYVKVMPLFIINATEELHEIQQQAVDAFCRTTNERVVPLWGPPGTGKTTTVVHAITTFVEVMQTKTKVLVCTPSNEAADLIVERLHKCRTGAMTPKKHLLRLHALSRDSKGVSEITKAYSYIKEYGNSFEFPSLDVISQATIVVTTMMTAARIFSLGLPTDHFDCLVVDEAGHAMEPLFMAAHLTAACAKRILLAGDHKQLGPHVRAPPNVKAKLDTSILERVITTLPIPYYQLTINHRSHPSLVHIVNVVYEDKLVPFNPSQENKFQGKSFDRYRVPDHPVMFLHHEFPESRENDSPSWMNQTECHYAVKCATGIQNQLNVPWQDIAIISPYRKQVKKITQILHYQGVSQCKVMTVEMFQGREARVIIVSCVRNSPEEAMKDIKFGIGFLKQPQRANVAMSRAKDLMIVLGNARLLVGDPLWGEYLKRIADMGGLRSAETDKTILLECVMGAHEDFPVSNNNNEEDEQMVNALLGEGISRPREE